MNLGVRKSSVLLTFFGFILGASIIVFSSNDTYAGCSEPSVGAIESTGATADTAGRVSCCSNGELKGWRYGAVFFTGGWSDESDWPTWTGSGSLDFTVRGAVYCCQTTNNNAYVTANNISFNYGISVSSTSLERSCNGDKAWGPISSAYLKATVPESALNDASCDNNNPANCKLTVNVTSQLGSSGTATYNSYIKFKYARTKYFTLKYDANGGSNAPAQQDDSTTDGTTTKAFTISSSSPTPPTGKKFIGWSTSSTATSASYSPGGSITIGEGTTTLYAVYEAYTIATFSAPEISISSSELNNTSGNNWKGFGDKTSYSLTATYHVKRTNSSPTYASSYYGTRATSSDDQVYPSNGTSTGDLSNDSIKDIPTTYSVSVANGTWATACFYLKYDSEVYYDGTTRVSVKATSTTYKCISVWNPAKNYATFSGSVSVSNGSGLSGTGTSRTGSGYKSTFTITSNYSITRTDGLSTPSTASSNYATNATSSSYNYWHYPSSPNANTGALGIAATDKTKSWTGSSTINIDIGAATQNRCFYLGFDTSVLYYDDDRQSGNYAGREYYCVSITNPPQTSTIYFTGAPVSGTLTENSRLERSDSNRVGKINNHDRKTNQSDPDENGRWQDNFTAMNAIYTADFSHKITRNDNSSTILGKTMDAKVSWQVQYAYPSTTPYINGSGQWVVAGVNWSNYAASMENRGNAVSGTTSLGASGSVTINTQPKLQASQGQILYYCQRVAYTASITYATISVSDKNDYGVNGGTPASMTTYSSPLCVTLKNPRWSETDIGHLTHNIVVTATPSDTEFTNGMFYKSGNAHETIAISPTLYINHTVTRNDTTGADESDAIFSGKFWQRSIYNNNAYKVTTNLSGYEKVIGLDSSRHLVPVVGGRALDGSFAVTLGASSKYSSDSWTSTKTGGDSKLVFNATGTNKYSVMAGQTRSFTIQSSVRPTKWTVEYKKINLNEYYTKKGSLSVTTAGPSTFDRIEKYHSSPQASTNPAHFDSNAVSFSVNRPYNFKITAVTSGQVSGVDGQVAYDDDKLNISYTIDIAKENNNHAYITDPNHTDNARYVYPISYIMPANISTSTINGTASNKGIHGGVESDICSHFNGLAKAGSCKIYTESSHPTKLSAAADSTNFNPEASPSGAVVSTIFRHVYDANSYHLSYRTGAITIQNPNGTPLAVGEKFCIAIAVRNYSSVSNNYFVSNSTCRNISKRPSLQAWGSSIIANGKIDTSESTYLNNRFGSWTDFGVISGNEIKRMNSGATAIGGIAKAKTICERSPLTIANQNCANSSNALGFSNVDARTGFWEKLLAYFKGNSTLGNLASGIAPNRTYIIRDTSNTITIAQDIINNHANSQVIIIGKNIKINSNVRRVDAWLVAIDSNGAGGTIDTCADVADESLSAGVCTNQLVINGQLSAGKVKFKRTYGGDPAENNLSLPAELVNYSPSTIIWGGKQAAKEGNPRTVYLRKLPVRY